MLVSVFAAAVIGLVVGGFLNVLADDLPQYQAPRHPHYPDGTPRPISTWLGITAFLTGQRKGLTWRYPLTEITTALAFVLVVVRVNTINAGDTMYINPGQTFMWMYHMAMFVLVTVIDVEHRLILFSVIIPSSLVAIIDAATTPSGISIAEFQWWHTSSPPFLGEALLGGLMGFAVFMVFYGGGFLYMRINAAMRGWDSDEVAFGYGDVMLITLVGFILGWRQLIFAMFITVFLGAFGAIFFLAAWKITGRRGGLLTPLPYGPYIVVGAIALMLFAEWVQSFLFGAVY